MYVHTCVLHLKSRCTETDSEQFLLDLCYVCLCRVSERRVGRGQWGGGGGGGTLLPVLKVV